MHSISINIVGGANSGKTTIAQIIEEALHNFGIAGTVEDEDIKTISISFDASDIRKRAKVIAKTTSVDIKTIQASRNAACGHWHKY